MVQGPATLGRPLSPSQFPRNVIARYEAILGKKVNIASALLSDDCFVPRNDECISKMALIWKALSS
jgi:hypothetical protein